MFSLKANNFRKIKHALIDVDGLVWVTGPNDNGKSCLLKAVPALMENSSGSAFINYDAKETEVELVFDTSEGRRKVNWVKPEKGSGTYCIDDGKPIAKTGASIPEEVSNLGFKIIQVKDKKYNLHYWPQGEYFLIKDTPSYIFLMISRLLKHRNLIPMLRKMKGQSSDMRDTEKELSGQFKLLERKRQSLADQLELYENFEEHEAFFTRFKSNRTLLKDCEDVHGRVNTLIGSFADVQDKKDQLNEVMESLSTLPDVSDKVVLLDQCVALKSRHDQVQVELGSISQDILFYVPLDFGLIESKLDMLRDMRILKSRADSLTETLANLNTDVVGYEGLAFEQVQSLIDKITRLKTLKDDVEEIVDGLEAIETRKAQHVKAREELDREFEQLYIDFPNCPTCGRPWNDCEDKNE